MSIPKSEFGAVYKYSDLLTYLLKDNVTKQSILFAYNKLTALMCFYGKTNARFLYYLSCGYWYV